VKKILFIILGSIFLGLGSLGIILPLLPTTPFLLLTAYFYVKSSEKLYLWLINHKVFGVYIKNYVEHRAITKKTKITAITLKWIGIISTIIIVNNIVVTIILAIIATSVMIYLLRLDTLVLNE